MLRCKELVVGKRGREAEQRGDADGGIWSAGQVSYSITYLYITLTGSTQSNLISRIVMNK